MGFLGFYPKSQQNATNILPKHSQTRSQTQNQTSKTKKNQADTKIQQINEIRKNLKKYQKFIEKNYSYVGNDFAYEARTIHYNNKKNSKGIYGSATKNQINELKEEGIETQVFPWLEDKNN